MVVYEIFAGLAVNFAFYDSQGIQSSTRVTPAMQASIPDPV